jgi:hypothetical protein
MLGARLLLIEDTTSDAEIFTDFMRQRLGEVEVDVCVRLGDAIHRLQNHGEGYYDQIWIDPGLPDLNTDNIGKALAILKRFAPVQMTSGMTAPAIAKQATEYNVPIIQKSAFLGGNTAALQAIVQEIRDIVGKKSNNGGNVTVRVEQARLQAALLKFEVQIGEIQKDLQKVWKSIEGYDELPVKVALLVDHMNQLLAMKNTLGEIEKALYQKNQEHQNRWEWRKVIAQSVVPVLLTGLFGLGAIALPKLLPDTDKPPQVQPSNGSKSSKP